MMDDFTYHLRRSSDSSFSCIGTNPPSYPSSPSQDRTCWKGRSELTLAEPPLTSPGRRLRWLCISIIALLATSIVGFIVWFTLVSAILRAMIYSRAGPKTPLSLAAKHWKAPDGSQSTVATWPANFSRGIQPVACHSHNDYWRPAPLFSALAVGCTGIEADIWLQGQDVLVGHTEQELRDDWTLKGLYLQPLYDMVQKQNRDYDGTPEEVRGIFAESPSATVVLLLDFKSDGNALWPYVTAQLASLRAMDWLTRWDPVDGKLLLGPLTIVASGTVPFDRIVGSSYHDVFYDAPLTNLDGRYNQSNSYYASTDLVTALGHVSSGLSAAQKDLAEYQSAVARAYGLVSRYWGTPGWPIGARTQVWEDLQASNVGILNVDQVKVAALLDWRQCTVLGVPVCT